MNRSHRPASFRLVISLVTITLLVIFYHGAFNFNHHHDNIPPTIDFPRRSNFQTHLSPITNLENGYTYIPDDIPLVSMEFIPDQTSDGLQFQSIEKKRFPKLKKILSTSRKNNQLLNQITNSKNSLINNNQIHPITNLIEEAKLNWNLILQQQSSSLQEAIQEYKLRYGRQPPLGFDQWYKFATDNEIILIDEYDQINIDIEPFLVLPKGELQKRAKILAENKFINNQFSLHIRGGNVTTFGILKNTYRANDANRLLSTYFSKYLQDMDLPFSGDDGASHVITGAARKHYTELARAGKRLDSEEDEVMDNESYTPWIKTCPENSNAKRNANGLHSITPSSTSPSFINHHHLLATDLCVHDEILPSHGFTNSWPGPGPQPLQPVFVWSKTQMHSNILLTPMDQFYTPTEESFAWNEKKSKIFYRGSSTGLWSFRDNAWKSSQRFRLIGLLNDKIGEMMVRFAGTGDYLRQFIGSVKLLNEHYFDVAFAGVPIQCDGTCQEMQNNYRFTPPMSVKDQNEFKYILDVDGNAWSGRFHRLMNSNSVVFKSTIFPEWYSQRLMPWYHYIPVKNDYSDLYDLAAYFIGSPDGKNSHDEAGQKIGQQSKEWTEQHWREVDLAAYQFRLYLEFARALYGDEGSHDFVMSSSL